jgi:hypothetical protein
MACFRRRAQVSVLLPIYTSFGSSRVSPTYLHKGKWRQTSKIWCKPVQAFQREVGETITLTPRGARGVGFSPSPIPPPWLSGLQLAARGLQEAPPGALRVRPPWLAGSQLAARGLQEAPRCYEQPACSTKIPFIHTSPLACPLHISSLLQNLGFARKGVLWSGIPSVLPLAPCWRSPILCGGAQGCRPRRRG